MDRLLPNIELDACTGCVACVDACMHNALEMRDGVAAVRDADACATDQHCVAACPTDAIQMGPPPG
jgi:Na+-translocating ferredoxin:NAD+ oxidoreductase RNF subunit RnfB